MLGQVAARGLQQPVPQDQIRLQLGAAKIEVAVPQPQLFRREGLALDARDRNRWRDRGSDDAKPRGSDLHLARRQLGVACVDRPLGHLAVD